MDPNANLREQRRLAKQLLETDYPIDVKAMLGIELAKLAAAMDEWLESGGFLPEAWSTTNGK